MRRKSLILTVFAVLAAYGASPVYADDVRFTFQEPSTLSGDYGVDLSLKDTSQTVPLLYRTTQCITCRTCAGDLKAKAIANSLNAISGGEYNAFSVNGACQVVVTSNPPWIIQKSGWRKGCEECTQKRKMIDDPTPEDNVGRVLLGLEGTGSSPGDTLVLSLAQFGTMDTVTFEILTGGKTATVLLTEMYDSLNLYDFSTSITDTTVMVYDLKPFVVFGTGDTALIDYAELEYVISIPTLSEWGMLIMALLLLAVGTIAVIRRRRAALKSNA